MKKLIVEEVNSFRAEVRAQARAAGQIRRQERYFWSFLSFKHPDRCFPSLPIPSREEILNSPMQGQEGTTSNFTAPPQSQRPPSPVMDDPSEMLERELAGTHISGR